MKTKTMNNSQKIMAWKHFRNGMDYKEIADMLNAPLSLIRSHIRKKLKEACDKLWSKEIRSVGACEITGATGILHAHHLLEKGAFPQYRFDLSNGICLSESVHIFSPEFSPHYSSASGKNFWDWMQEHRPGQYQWWDEHRQIKGGAGEKVDYLEIYNKLKRNRT